MFTAIFSSSQKRQKRPVSAQSFLDRRRPSCHQENFHRSRGTEDTNGSSRNIQLRSLYAILRGPCRLWKHGLVVFWSCLKREITLSSNHKIELQFGQAIKLERKPRKHELDITRLLNSWEVNKFRDADDIRQSTLRGCPCSSDLWMPPGMPHGMPHA